MATAANESPDNCSICIEQFKDPRILTCFHTFCLDCLQTFVTKSSDDGKFLCPLCRHEVTLPENGVAGFPENIYIDARVKKQAHSVSERCGVCDQPATHMCHECEIFLCEACTKHHRALPVTRSHMLICLEDPAEGKRFLSRDKFCEKHKEEKLIFFCEKCSVTICRNCKLTSHDGHKALDICDVVDDARCQLVDMKNKLEKRIQKIEKSYDVIKEKHVMVTSLLDKAKTEINKSADQLMDMINNAKNKAMDKVRGMEKIKEIKFQDANCEHRQKKLFLQGHIDHIGNMLKDGLDCDVTATASEMKQRRDELDKNSSVCVDSFIQNMSLSSIPVPSPAQLQSVDCAINDIIRNSLPLSSTEPVVKTICTPLLTKPNRHRIISVSFNQFHDVWIVYEETRGIFIVKTFISLYKQARLKHKVPVDLADLKHKGLKQCLQTYNYKNEDNQIPKIERQGLMKEYPHQDVNSKGDRCWVDEQKQIALIQLSNGVVRSLTFNPFSKPHEPFHPCDICWGNNDELYIVDRRSNTIVVYSLAEGFLKSLFIPDKQFSPSAVAMDNEGNLWIGEYGGALSVCKV